MEKNIPKSIWAVFAGFVTVVILSMATDSVLEATGIFPPPDKGFFVTWMMAAALIYRCVFTIIGGYVTAAVAPRRPVHHAIVLGIIGTAFAIVGCFIGWDLSAHWYPISLVITALPCTWLGGKWRVSRKRVIEP